ncbi:V4R domain-containing protein [Litchfieldia alkalitelluris]|uniref:4-vinyl reductase n=2 Tax=Evansella alkalicola TaxID=745819 RepID=A0ABS6JXR3_9BACI|nr:MULTISPECIES: V4R domain-containing protein [Bacillaceae]MBU9723288.1 4-vinyl reductase [Bacillus alkalicola]
MSFQYEDMKKIDRKTLGKEVPLELFRSIRLIGMYQGLPLNGKSTTATIGRKIGESLPVHSVEGALNLFEELKIGIPRIIEKKDNEFHIAIDECFCKGLPKQPGNKVCDLEGAILEGALEGIIKKRVRAREVKCNVNGDECCEYKVKTYEV